MKAQCKATFRCPNPILVIVLVIVRIVIVLVFVLVIVRIKMVAHKTGMKWAPKDIRRMEK